MTFVQPSPGKLLTLKLTRELTRSIKRGHPWVFADALRHGPDAAPGTQARLLDRRDREIARGYYDSSSNLAFRVCSLNKGENLDDRWAEAQLEKAIRWRQNLFDAQTTGYRLINGEGDQLPGLVCDIYGEAAVLKLDGPAATAFWQAAGIGRWLADRLNLRQVYERVRSRESAQGQAIVGAMSTEPVSFLENGVAFTADLVHGQKTGFFLDQRENRQRIRQVAAGKRVLNLFGYTGGFSVYAGLGGASQVTTVDVAQPALEAAQAHWHLNQLPEGNHQIVGQDAFAFLQEAQQQKQQWDLVILDPPSFAPAKKAVPKATKAYEALITAGATVTAPHGLLAAASCSSHISLPMFLETCETAISQARRRATVLDVAGQPPDHPAPLVLPEFRYLKFVLMRLDD